MSTTGKDDRTIAFGDFAFDRATRELRRCGELVPLRPKASIVLATLIEQRPAMVRHEALRAALWDDRAVEWQAGLHQVVRQLRRALGDDPRAPRFIATVPSRGYRFVAEVGFPAPPRAWLGRLRHDVAVWLFGGLTLPALVVVLCVVLARS